MTHTFSRLLLQAQIFTQRLGLIWLFAAALLLLAAFGQFVWQPHLQNQYTQGQAALIKVNAALAKPVPPPVTPELPLADRNLAAFYSALGERAYLEQQNHALFLLAEKAGLSLRQGDYKMVQERQGRFLAYTALLPVKGTYSQIVQFCEQSLLQIPFASLDELGFKRDQVANRTLDGRIKFTLYLRENSKALNADDEAMHLPAILTQSANAAGASNSASTARASNPGNAAAATSAASQTAKAKRPMKAASTPASANSGEHAR